MQVPFIKYIETLVVGKLPLSEVNSKLAEINRDFPSKGLSIIYKRFAAEQPEYFNGKEEMDSLWLAD